jgi:pilus assembly protein CpaB
MKRPSPIVIAGGLAFVFAACASLLAYTYLSRQADSPMEGVAIVAAATDLPVGAKLDSRTVKLATWPKGSVPPGSFSELKGALGRVVVRQVSAGDIITEQKLLPLNASSSGGVMTYIVPQGHRAVTVAVNEVAGVAGFITPNSRVDVVLTSPLPGDKDQENNISKIILQNVPVLAIGQVTVQKDEKPTVVQTVTLDLSPDDAEKLIVGANNPNTGARKGTLQLLLRNVLDSAPVSTQGATVTRVLGQGERTSSPKVPAVKAVKSAPKAQSPAPPPHTEAKYSVEVIKGSSKSTREFSAD